LTDVCLMGQGQAAFCCTDEKVESVEEVKASKDTTVPADNALSNDTKDEKAVEAELEKKKSAEGVAQSPPTEAPESSKANTNAEPIATSITTEEKIEAPKPPEEQADGATDQQTVLPTDIGHQTSVKDDANPVLGKGQKNTNIKDDRRPSINKAACGDPFPKRQAGELLSQEVWNKVEEIFKQMDQDLSNAVTRQEAQSFFTGAFSKISVDAMFKSIDDDMSGAITGEEFVKFWRQVKISGHSDKEMLEELEEIQESNQWVATALLSTASSKMEEHRKFPSKPLLSRLSGKAWNKCEELFRAMSKKGDLVITREKAGAFFTGSYSHISVNAMFHEIDTMNHGQIAPKAFMDFWKQVRSSGYSNQQIIEEIDNMLNGGGWVDWNDGRTT